MKIKIHAKNRSTALWVSAIAGLLLGGLQPLSAQVATTKAPTAEGETIELSPFIVDASKDSGYYTNETLAGGRMKANLSDLATSVQVMTAEFLSDIGATGLDEVLLYATNTDVEGRGSNFIDTEMGTGQELSNSASRASPEGANRVRGLGRATRTVDYFQTDIPFDSYISGRVDINRGANSFLFGLGAPGGIVNSSTGYASLGRNSTKLEVELSTENFESNMSRRSSINLNRVVIPKKLAVRVAGMVENEEYTQRPASKDTQRTFGAFTLVPFKKKITLRGSFEQGTIKSNPANRLGPLENLSTFLNDPRGIVWPKTTANPSGRMWVNAYQALRASRGTAGTGLAGYGYMGLDNNGIRITTLNNSTGAPVGGGWTPVFDGSQTADGLPTRAIQLSTSQWINGNATFDPDNNFAGARASTFTGPPGLANTGLFNNWSEQGLIDYAVYDWRTQLLSGGLDYSNQKFDRKNFTIEMLSDRGDFGLELSFDQQNFDRVSGISIGNPRLSFDVNETLPVGPNALFGPTNPNFGRLFIYTPVTTMDDVPSSRETARATGFAKFDFQQKFDNGILRWFGRHVITGLLDRTENKTAETNWAMSSMGAEVGFHLNDYNVGGNGRRARSLIYVGPQQLDAWNPSFTMADFQVGNLPGNLAVSRVGEGHTVQVAYWNVGNPATDLNNTSVLGDERPAVTDVTYGMIANGAKLDQTKINSWALNLQSFFLREHLVANLGWRGDEVGFKLNSSPPQDPITSEKLTAPAGFNLDATPVRITEAKNFAYGLVLKVPDRFLPENSKVSFHYGQSTNFTPSPDGYDIDGNITPPTDGGSKDYGVTYSYGNKFSVRFNLYTGNATNLGSGAGSGAGYGYGVMASQQIMNILHATNVELDQWDWNKDGKFDNPAVDLFTGAPTSGVAGPDGILDQFAANNPMSLSQLHAFNAAWQTFATPFMRESTRYVFTPSTVPGANNATGAIGNDLYFILKDTQDLEAKGKELEFTYNPTRNWRLAFNATQQSSKVANSYPRLGIFGERYRAALDSVPNTVLSNGTIIPFDTYRSTGNYLEIQPEVNKYAAQALYGRYYNNSFGGQTYLYAKAVEGQEDPKVREYRFNFITNYSFSEGRFKGLNIGGAFRYQSAAAIGFALIQDPVTLDSYPNPKVAYNDKPSEFVDMWIGYNRKVFNKKVTWKVQLNVRNVFADTDPLVAQFQPDGSWARAQLPAPRQIILRNTFEF